MPNVLCLSDLHGYLPNPVSLPRADICVIAGDICPVFNPSPIFQRSWLEADFANWCNHLDVGSIILVGGNHDFFLQDNVINNGNYNFFSHVPRLTYLENDSCYVTNIDGRGNGISIWGSPYSLNFQSWAFMCDDHTLNNYYSLIPENTDIIVSHTPPYMHRDRCLDGEWAGSRSLVKVIDRVKPKLVVCGHIHEGHGIAYRSKTKIVNASIMTASYKPENPAIMVSL